MISNEITRSTLRDPREIGGANYAKLITTLFHKSFKNTKKRIDIRLIVVDISTHPTGSRFFEAFVERISAVAATADSDILLSEFLADIVEICVIGKYE